MLSQKCQPLLPSQGNFAQDHLEFIAANQFHTERIRLISHKENQTFVKFRKRSSINFSLIIPLIAIIRISYCFSYHCNKIYLSCIPAYTVYKRCQTLKNPCEQTHKHAYIKLTSLFVQHTLLLLLSASSLLLWVIPCRRHKVVKVAEEKNGYKSRELPRREREGKKNLWGEKQKETNIMRDRWWRAAASWPVWRLMGTPVTREDDESTSPFLGETWCRNLSDDAKGR